MAGVMTQSPNSDGAGRSIAGKRMDRRRVAPSRSHESLKPSAVEIHPCAYFLETLLPNLAIRPPSLGGHP
jgi:hypothetical protein